MRTRPTCFPAQRYLQNTAPCEWNTLTLLEALWTKFEIYEADVEFFKHLYKQALQKFIGSKEDHIRSERAKELLNGLELQMVQIYLYDTLFTSGKKLLTMLQLYCTGKLDDGKRLEDWLRIHVLGKICDTAFLYSKDREVISVMLNRQKCQKLREMCLQADAQEIPEEFHVHLENLSMVWHGFTCKVYGSRLVYYMDKTGERTRLIIHYHHDSLHIPSFTDTNNIGHQFSTYFDAMLRLQILVEHNASKFDAIKADRVPLESSYLPLGQSEYNRSSLFLV
ncbi:hypothetical protein BJV82DRAFT_575211 [Fennellomyces sp. T-0311]|nr:hypothetical protein BJV82DRAFT_575211 [Fennellomyces sp. T-0311]